MATPSVAPDPARPTMCSEPMLEAKIDAPMTHQPRLRPARKVVGGGVLVVAHDPPGDGGQDAEIEGDDAQSSRRGWR